MGGTNCTQDEQIATGRAAKRLALVRLLTLMTSGRRIRKKTEGGSKFSKAKKCMLKLHACEKALSDAVQKECDDEEEHYGRIPDRVVPDTTFQERQFGDLITRHRARDFPCSVVSIALFDGVTMLFSCSGVPLPRGRSKLEITRYVTSACLATEYESKRYRDDKLRIEVKLPNGEKNGGLLELCNNHIAIVTLLDDQDGRPMDVELQAGLPSDDDEILAVGRAFESGTLMAAKVKLAHYGRFEPDKLQLDPPNSEECLCFWKPVSSYEGGPVAVLGGPVLGKDNRVIGMNIDVDLDGACVSFLPLALLCTYLKHFRILNPEELHFRQYSLPDHVNTIVPSGFRSNIYRLRHLGYPMPPPLVLEFNGELLNQFEDFFGDVQAWKGYPFGSPNYCDEPVWRHLRKDVVKDISRRVVSIASFHGYERYFACTGLLIKWHQRTVVLTSASLVRSCNDENGYEDKIDNDLKIEVFLPPKQRASGKLELYSLKYNIAIVSFEKKFTSICPEDIFSKYSTRKSSGKVVAVGSEPLDGLLMASIGKVKRRDNECKLDCIDLKLSTCKIKKAGIGGPLINLDGSFVGMNFFDGRMLTPFLPRSKIFRVLRSKINLPLPSERGFIAPVHLKGSVRGNSYRWPVPEPYWYHGLLDVDEAEHEHIGRSLKGGGRSRILQRQLLPSVLGGRRKKYNIAIVSFEKKFTSICPEDIFSKYSTRKSSGKVVAVGSEPLDGLLMASIGKVKRRDNECKLDCIDLKLSTCKIKKELQDSVTSGFYFFPTRLELEVLLLILDGSFVGMNFFDGRMLTPFLPRSKIFRVLRSKINLPLPSERGFIAPVHLKGSVRGNRWPVPEPYWYHGLLDVDEAEHEK